MNVPFAFTYCLLPLSVCLGRPASSVLVCFCGVCFSVTRVFYHVPKCLLVSASLEARVPVTIVPGCLWLFASSVISWPPVALLHPDIGIWTSHCFCTLQSLIMRTPHLQTFVSLQYKSHYFCKYCCGVNHLSSSTLCLWQTFFNMYTP